MAFAFCPVLQYGFGQNWQPITNLDPLTYDYRAIYSDSIDNYLYVGGTFASINGVPMKNIARWDGVQWYTLGSGTNLLSRPVEIIARYQGEIFAGGSFLSMGGVYSPTLARWNGTQWDSLPVQGFHESSADLVSALEVIDNELWVGGAFTYVDGQPCLGLAKWNGTSWNPIGMPPIIENYSLINAICEFQGEIYIGGGFNSYQPVNEDSVFNIMRYDGTNWKSVGGGIRGIWSEIRDMIVYNGELYVTGNFFKSHGNAGNAIQKWDGSQWSEVGGGFRGYNDAYCGKGWDLHVYNNKLYAVGEMEYAGGVVASRIAIWDGLQWCGLGSEFDGGVVSNIGFYNDSMYVLGGFWTIDSDSIYSIAQWTGGNFVDQCGNNAGIENEEDVLINIYPNPAEEYIMLSIPNLELNIEVTYSIYNMLGEVVATGIITNDLFQINISNFAQGLYSMEITIDKKKINKKFLKM